MKKLLIILLGFSCCALADENYTFNMTVNQLSEAPENPECDPSLAAKLKQDIAANPQLIQLSGYYDTQSSIGSYSVLDYQVNGKYVLNPLGISGCYDFAKWNKSTTITIHGETHEIYAQNLTINGHHYPLYGIIFDVPKTCGKQKNGDIDQSQWGTCGKLELLIPDGSANGVCMLSSTPESTLSKG